MSGQELSIINRLQNLIPVRSVAPGGGQIGIEELTGLPGFRRMKLVAKRSVSGIAFKRQGHRPGPVRRYL